MTEEQIVARIQEALVGAQVLPRGEDCHLGLTVVSDAFEGKGLLARHRMIQDLFRSELANGSLHALSLTTLTLNEFQSKEGSLS